MKDFKLCPHITIKVDKEKKLATITKGPAYPHFGWDIKRQADTPRIKCSECGKNIQILGYTVERAPGSRYVPRRDTSGTTATRKPTRQKDQVSIGKETWGFVD